MTIKTALITGVTGQTGSYLAELLLKKGYIVAGLKRRHASYDARNLRECFRSDQFSLLDGDMTDETSLRALIDAVNPDEIYNMAAMSFVAESWNTPTYTNEVNYLGFIKLLEAVRDLTPKAKVYQASSSEMYGNQPPPQSELTRMTPRSPYGVSKLAAHRIAQVYRESFGMFISCGICFNHESPRRGAEFVTRKIVNGLAVRAIWSENPKLKLGYLDSKRDWGYAPDYARAMWMMLQRGAPDDFVIATGETHSVREFLDLAFAFSGLGGDVDDHVEIDESLYRPAEVYELRGDPARANEFLGWQPEVGFEELVEKMYYAEFERLRNDW